MKLMITLIVTVMMGGIASAQEPTRALTGEIACGDDFNKREFAELIAAIRSKNAVAEITEFTANYEAKQWLPGKIDGLNYQLDYSITNRVACGDGSFDCLDGSRGFEPLRLTTETRTKPLTRMQKAAQFIGRDITPTQKEVKLLHTTDIANALQNLAAKMGDNSCIDPGGVRINDYTFLINNVGEIATKCFEKQNINVRYDNWIDPIGRIHVTSECGFIRTYNGVAGATALPVPGKCTSSPFGGGEEGPCGQPEYPFQVLSVD